MRSMTEIQHITLHTSSMETNIIIKKQIYYESISSIRTYKPYNVNHNIPNAWEKSNKTIMP